MCVHICVWDKAKRETYVLTDDGSHVILSFLVCAGPDAHLSYDRNRPLGPSFLPVACYRFCHIARAVTSSETPCIFIHRSCLKEQSHFTFM